MARRRVVGALLAAAAVGVGVVAAAAAAAAPAAAAAIPRAPSGGGGVRPRQPLSRDRPVYVGGRREPRPRGRVINGRVVGPREGDAGAQFMAKLFLPGGDRFYCAGSVLSYRTILTAAHCFTGGTSIPVNAVGDEVRVGGRGIMDGIASTIESVEIHPTFDITSYIGDVAIVTMARSFTREQAVAAGVYPAKLGTDGMVGPDTELSLSGWGVTNVDVAAQAEAAAAAAAAQDAASEAAPDVNAYDTYPYHVAHGHEAVDAYERQRITTAGTVGGSAARSASAGPSATAQRTAATPPSPPPSLPARPMPVMLRQAGVLPQNGTQGGGPPTSPGRRLVSPNTLLTAKVFARPMAECVTFAQDVIGVSEFATSLYDADSELCLSLMDNVGACSGDSGSPFFTQMKHPDGYHSYFVHGIMSFSYPSPTEDCPPSFPDWGTRVSHYTDWITERVIYE